MGEKYEPVRAGDFYTRPSEDRELRTTTKGKTQLEKLEEKVASLQLDLRVIQTQLNLTANIHNVVDAINNSPQGLRIRGSKIIIDKETTIENGVIKP